MLEPDETFALAALAVPSADTPLAHALSQVEIIRSLAGALAWFQQELAWSVPPQALKHLSGRIGELYAAMITRGQMAFGARQPGYDVVSAEGERISVKTITTSSHVSFKKSTLSHADRAIILRLEVEGTEVSIVEVFDGTRDELVHRCSDGGAVWNFAVRPPKAVKPTSEMTIVAEANYREWRVVQYENSTIIVLRNGVTQPNAKAELREIAEAISVSPLNGAGQPRNTRQLGAAVIAALIAGPQSRLTSFSA